MPVKKSNREILDELQLLLRVKHVYVSELERKAKSLDGLPLKIEEERRTEAAIFIACYTRVNDPVRDYEREYVISDQRRFEMYEFTNSMRLERTGKGILPSYIIRAHDECIRVFGELLPAAA